MDNVLFLNSSGAVVTDHYPYPVSSPIWDFVPRITEDPLPIVPYVEQVALPTASVDPAALLGNHPEEFAVVSHSSAAALTFFCDSVAGGQDSSGNGSFDRPWRSLRTASQFLSCHSSTLLAAAKYVQLKIRGDMAYASGTRWEPFAFTGGSRLILTGWGSRCDCSGVRFEAEYFFNLRTTPLAYDAMRPIFSDCTVLSANFGGALAVDCRLESAGGFACAVNCSVGPVWGAALCGGSFGEAATFDYAYAPVIDMTRSGGTYVSTGPALFIGSAAVGAKVTVRATAAATVGESVTARAYGAGGSRGALFIGCSVSVEASAQHPHAAQQSGEARTEAFAQLLGGPAVLVSGGDWRGSATALASHHSQASAAATIRGFPADAVITGDVPANLVASAGAKVSDTSRSSEDEYETVVNFGTSAWKQRHREFSGGVQTSGYVSSGYC